MDPGRGDRTDLDELRALRKVASAARAWRSLVKTWVASSPDEAALIAAVDALRSP